MGKGSVSHTTMIKGLTAGAIAVASLGILTVGEYAIPQESTVETVSSALVEVVSTEGLTFTPGTYTASAAGISSDVVVTCTFDEKGITDMTVDVSGETAGFGADIGETVIDQVLTAQSNAIDGVSGVTITSDAVKAAVADCIAQAGGAVPSENQESTAESSETELLEETIETEISGETEILIEEESESEHSAQDGLQLTDGIYTASAAGIQSDVMVTMTISEGEIESVELDVSGETPELGAEIGDEMAEKILFAQNADIDGVAGATITSDAVKTAAADCLQQAQAVSAPQTAADSTGAYLDGVYSATAQGIDSEVAVVLTIKSGKIRDAVADVSGETAGLGAEIGEEMADQIIAAQSAAVEGVSGATVTSSAVKTAAEAALKQASQY